MKKVLTIAGSDCSGGAGIQADLKTMCAHGVFGMSVIVSVVAENTARVLSIADVSPEMIAAQMDAVFEDIVPDSIKIGMLSSPACMQVVADKLKQYQPAHVVIDPVMYAKNGDALMDVSAVDTLVQTVLPLAEVLTPNLHEAEHLAGMPIRSIADMELAAQKILARGCRYVLVKGGSQHPQAEDVFASSEGVVRLTGEHIDTKNTHGTGCTLSSAIACNLAKGETVLDAVRHAKAYVNGAIAHALPIGHGNGPLNHFYK